MREKNMKEENRFGLSKSEIIYLIIFDVLDKETYGSLEVAQRVKHILDPTGQSPNRSYVYRVMKKMEELGWVHYYDSSKRNANLYLTSEGRKHWELMKRKNFEVFKKIKDKIQYFIDILENREAKPVVLTRDEMKLFNRTINVKIAIHYFFLSYLCNHEQVSGLSFVKAMKHHHDWDFNDGYFYTLTRMMEKEPYQYVTGQWDDERNRNEFHYDITAIGRSMIGHEYETLLKSLKDNLNYLCTVMDFLTI